MEYRTVLRITASLARVMEVMPAKKIPCRHMKITRCKIVQIYIDTALYYILHGGRMSHSRAEALYYDLGEFLNLFLDYFVVSWLESKR